MVAHVVDLASGAPARLCPAARAEFEFGASRGGGGGECSMGPGSFIQVLLVGLGNTPYILYGASSDDTGRFASCLGPGLKT